MATITSEELFPAFGYSGNVDISESAPVNGPTNIVRTSESWFVKFDWTTTGWLNFFLAGNWNLEVLLEKMGPGEFDIGPSGKTITPIVSAPNAYSTTLSFGPGSVPAGLYRASAVLTFKNPVGIPGRITGFTDLGLIEFYDTI
jgi:hypothetical protein